MPSIKKFLYVFLPILILPMLAFAQLNADFVASKTADCPPFAVTLTSTSTGSPTSYTWQIGSWSTTTTTPYVSYTIGAPGNYTCKLTISNGSSTDVETKTNYITVYPKPTVNFNATTPVAGCSPLTVTFQDASTLNAPGTGTYSWFWGSTGNGANPTATFTNPGTQDVTLTVTNSFGCNALLTKTAFINVRARPVPSFSASPVDFCSSPCSTNFTGSATGSGPFTYLWQYGDGGTPGTGNTSSHTYIAPPNTWSPKLIVTDATGCKDSITRPNYINIHYPTTSISSASSVCQKSSITFSGTYTPAGGSMFWDFGDGLGTSSAASPSYSYSTSGSFTVTLTYNYKGCIATATKVITVHPKPIADFIVNPDTLCPAPVSVQLIPNGTYATYYWNNGASPVLTSTSPSPTFTYYNNGHFSPTLIVSTAAGCKDTIVKSGAVKIHDIYTVITPYKGSDKIDRAKIEGCKPLTIFFSDTTYTNIPGNVPRYYPNNIQSYDWNWGDNTAHGTLQHMSHTFVDTGVFRVILTVTTTKGCIAKDTVEVRVGQPPIPDFTASPLHICIRGYVQFTNLTTGPVDTWKWKFGEGSESTAKDPRHQYNWPDTMDVTLTAIHKGCIASITKPYYILVDSPKSLFNTERFCDSPLKVRFHNTSLGHTSYRWFFGDPSNTTIATDNDPYFRYPAAGTYNVTLVTFSSRTGCSDTTVYPLELSTRSMTLTANDTAVCNGDSVTFTSVLTGRQPLAYEFYLDNTYIGTTTGSIKWPINGSGFHKVKVIALDLFGCSDSVVKYNWIFVSIPAASFSGSPTNGCIPFNVAYTDNSSVTTGAVITNRLWNYGIGSNVIVSGTSSSFNYATRGQFDVKLVITDNVGCKDSITKSKYIKASKPIADFSVQDTACLNSLLNFDSLSVNGVSFSWDFGDGGTSLLSRPKHAYTALGSYNVRLIVTDTLGCKDTLLKPNAVTISKPFPAFSISPDSVAVCPPLLVKFTSNSTNTWQYYWRMGLGNTSTLSSPSEFYTTKGKYRIVLVATDAYGCIDSAISNVRILGYDGAFDYTPLIGCKPLDVNFNAIVNNVAKLAWDFDDGIVVNTTSTTISHKYTRPGAYVPRVIFEDANGCKSLSSGIDTIKVDAVEPAFKGDAPCQYSTVTLIDTSKTYFSSINYWKWTFDDGSTSTMKAPTHFYGAPGQYPVKLVVRNAQGCIDSTTRNLTIHALPVINAGLDTIICLNDTAQLNASGGISYIWNTTPYLSCLDCPDPKASPKEYFSFVVKGTDVNNCSNTDTVLVKIKTKVIATPGPDREICLKDTAQLYVNGGNTYQWSPSGGLDNPTSRTPIASPANTTKYKVITYEGRCIPDTDFVNIKIHPLPEVTATGAKTIIAGNSTILNATGNLINRFKWSPAESLNCADCPDPTAAPKKTTEYTITVYTDFGCVDSDKVTVKVLCDESQLFIPNTFTPNGDGQNDVFYPRGTGLDKVRSFRVYNRWGEVVFERTGMPLNDATYAWDGTYKGATLPPDVFVYVVEALCESGEIMTIKGDVTLIR